MYKTHSSSISNVMTAADYFVPACLSLALFFTGHTSSHSANQGSFFSVSNG